MVGAGRELRNGNGKETSPGRVSWIRRKIRQTILGMKDFLLFSRHVINGWRLLFHHLLVWAFTWKLNWMPKYAKKDLVEEPTQERFGTGGGTGYTQLLLIEHTFLLMEAYGKPILIDVSLSFCNHFVSRKEEEGGTPLLFSTGNTVALEKMSGRKRTMRCDSSVFSEINYSYYVSNSMINKGWIMSSLFISLNY